MHKWMILTTGFCWWAATLPGQETAGRFPLTHPVILGEEEGMPDNYITAITGDSAGFMWFGTWQGVCRYDGSRMEVYQHQEGTEASLPHNNVLDMLVDRTGRLWVATTFGLARYHAATNSFRKVLPNPSWPEEQPGPRVNCVLEDRQGEFWLGLTNFGLVKLDTATGVVRRYEYEVETDDPAVDLTRIQTVIDVVQDLHQDSILWLATLAGLVRYNKITGDHRWYYHRLAEADHRYRFNAMKKLVMHPDGSLFVGSWGGAAVFDPRTGRFDLIVLNPAQEERRISDRMVWSMLLMGDDELWISYTSGLMIYHVPTGAIRRVFFNDADAGKVFGAEYLDQEGRIWTRSDRGVFLFNPMLQQFTIHTFPRPADRRDLLLIPRAVVESNGELLFCVEGGEGIYRFDRRRQRWTVVPPPDAQDFRPGEFHGQDMIRLSDGRILVLTRQRLYLYDEAARRLVATPYRWDEDAPYFRRLVEGENGDVWIGSRRGGLYRVNLKTGRHRVYRRELDLPGSSDNRYIWLEQLMNDRRGNIWIRTASGYSVYDIRRDSFFNLDFRASNPEFSFAYVCNFTEGPDGRVWITSEEPGLGWADPEFPERGLQEKIALSSQARGEGIAFSLWDEEGLMWINHEHGLTRFDPRTRQFAFFDRGYGKPRSGGEFIVRLASGEIVIDAPQGFTIFHPKRLRLNPETPRPYLVALKVMDQVVPLRPGQREVRLSHRKNFLSFDFSAIGFNLPEHMNFVYKLEGLEEHWNDAGQRTYASYPQLPGGDYVFRLKVANSEGLWSEEPLALAIHINTPWWRQWWFWSLTGLALLGSGLAFIRWRIEQVRRQEQLRSEFERRLADVEMHALRSQMNPHFIFNSLNSIDYYILKNETDKASDYLNRFSRLIRLILQNSRANMVSLRDELEALRLYIEMESLRFNQQFDYEVRVDPDLRTDEVEIPPMLLQPYVENAIWHGLMQKKGKGRLELTLTRRNGALHCTITDNGIGREAARQIQLHSSRRRRSMGMQITSDRISMINKLYNKEAQVRITDLQDEAGRPKGTQVELDIPL